MMDDPKSCPSSFLFLSCTEFFDYGTSPYAFCNSNPVNYVDVDGEFPDFIWNLASIGMGVRSLVDNIQEGNTRAAIGDGVGIVADVIAAAIPVLPGGVGAVRAGAKAAAKADDVVDAARGVDASKNVFKNRVKLRKETKEKIRKNAARDVDGRYIDPNTGMSIEPGQEVFGHKSGQEWRKYKSSPENQNKTRQAVIEEQNNPDIYQIEDRISNASHKYEYE